MITNLQQYCSICTLLNVTHSKVTAVKTINNEQKTLQPFFIMYRTRHAGKLTVPKT